MPKPPWLCLSVRSKRGPVQDHPAEWDPERELTGKVTDIFLGMT
jgi:hypothetical protein